MRFHEGGIRKVLDLRRNKEGFFILHPQERFLVLRVSKKRILISHRCSRGASTSKRSWSSKCSMWTTCRGRTCVRLTEQYLSFLQRCSGEYYRRGDWISTGFAHIRFVQRYDLDFMFIRYALHTCQDSCLWLYIRIVLICSWLIWLIFACNLEKF